MRSLPEPCWLSGHSLLRLFCARDAGKLHASSEARPRESRGPGKIKGPAKLVDATPELWIRVKRGARDRGEGPGRCSELLAVSAEVLHPLKLSCPQPPATAVVMPTPEISFPCLDMGKEQQEFLLGASSVPLGDPSHVSFWLPPLWFSTSQRPDGVFAF